MHLDGKTMAGPAAFNRNGVRKPDLVAGNKQFRWGDRVGNGEVEDGLISFPFYIAYAEFCGCRCRESVERGLNDRAGGNRLWRSLLFVFIEWEIERSLH